MPSDVSFPPIPVIRNEDSAGARAEPAKGLIPGGLRRQNQSPISSAALKASCVRLATPVFLNME